MEPSTANPSTARRLPRAVGMLRAFSRNRIPQQQQQSTPCPRISSPIGPVKSSRGMDLTRSDSLTIVVGIDCDTCIDQQEPKLERVASDKLQKQSRSTESIVSSVPIPPISSGTEKRISSQEAPPMLIKSSVTTTTTLNIIHGSSQLQKTPPRQGFIKPSASVPLLDPLETPKPVHFGFKPLPTTQQDENTPPGSSSGIQQPLKSKLPKSRTMGVLHELKTSITRPSTSSRAGRLSSIRPPRIGNTPSTDSGKTVTPASVASPKLSLPHASLTSLVRSSASATPEPPQPHDVSGHQPSTYWTGRFLALHDRFLSEAMADSTERVHADAKRSMSSKQSASMESRSGNGRVMKASLLDSSTSELPFSHKTKLPHANTTSSLSKIMFKQPQHDASEDDDRCRRIFRRLEECCISTEAKQSLHDWQYAYARRVNRPSLLPSGRSMDEKSRVARFFSASSGTKKGVQQRPRQNLPGVPIQKREGEVRR